MEKKTGEYKIIRSRRKTVSVEISEDATVIVRAPGWMSVGEIDRFVESHSGWIEDHIAKVEKRNVKASDNAPISENELNALLILAEAQIPDKVRHYAQLIGVTFGKVTIRNQKTLWGSCTSDGNLSFNCLIMKAPESVRDYVIVHELCHRKEMNHSKAFWKCVESVLPDYRTSRRWLKEEGDVLMRSYSYLDRE